MVGGKLDVKSRSMLEEKLELAGLESGTSFSRELESVKRTAVWKHQHYQNPAVLPTSCKAGSDPSLLPAQIMFPNALLKKNARKNVCQAPSLESILSFLGVP